MNKLKPALETNFYDVLIVAANTLRYHHYENGKDDTASEIEKFLVVLGGNKENLNGSARNQIEKNRAVRTRKPVKLPLDENLFKLRHFMIKRMIQLLEEYHFWTMHNYIKLRNITAARLTLLCGGKGSEPGRALRNKWKEDEFG